MLPRSASPSDPCGTRRLPSPSTTHLTQIMYSWLASPIGQWPMRADAGLSGLSLLPEQDPGTPSRCSINLCSMFMSVYRLGGGGLPFAVPQGRGKSALWAVDGRDIKGMGYSYNSPPRETTGLLLPGDTNRNGCRLPGPLPNTQQVAGHHSPQAAQDGGAWVVRLQPALPRILPTHAVAAQTPMCSPRAALMLDISPKLPQHAKLI